LEGSGFQNWAFVGMRLKKKSAANNSGSSHPYQVTITMRADILEIVSTCIKKKVRGTPFATGGAKATMERTETIPGWSDNEFHEQHKRMPDAEHLSGGLLYSFVESVHICMYIYIYAAYEAAIVVEYLEYGIVPSSYRKMSKSLNFRHFSE